jgi:hypothetical protein
MVQALLQHMEEGLLLQQEDGQAGVGAPWEGGRRLSHGQCGSKQQAKTQRVGGGRHGRWKWEHGWRVGEKAKTKASVDFSAVKEAAGSVAADSKRKRSALVEADMGGGSGDTDGGLVKKAKTKASVDFSAVKRKRSASVEADMEGGSGDMDGGLMKKAKTKASVDFSVVKEASAAKKAASMPPVDKNEDTPEIAVARYREVRKLIDRIRQTCTRSVSLSKEPGNALTRFFFLSQIDSRKQGALAPDNGRRAEYGGEDLAMHDVLIPFNAGKDTCLHRELLKAGLEPGK